MTISHQVLDLSPQELGLLEYILQVETSKHPETAEDVRPLLNKVTAHFAAAFPYDYQECQKLAAILEDRP